MNKIYFDKKGTDILLNILEDVIQREEHDINAGAEETCPDILFQAKAISCKAKEALETNSKIYEISLKDEETKMLSEEIQCWLDNEDILGKEFCKEVLGEDASYLDTGVFRAVRKY